MKQYVQIKLRELIPSEAQDYLPIPWIGSNETESNTWYDTIVRRDDVLENAVHYQLFLDIHKDDKRIRGWWNVDLI